MNYQLLPDDVMFQILSKLPAETVIRFKCVCKSWNALLEDHNFIQKHTMNITENTKMIRNPNQHLLVSCRDNSTNKRVFVSMSSSDSSSSSSSSLISRFINKKKEFIPSSFSNKNYGQMRLIGPCNGIVCFYGYRDQIALCNPTIGDFKTLPSSTIQRPSDANIRGGDVGLGYDPNTDDYKVIQILSCITTHHHHHNRNHNRKIVYNQVEIYSLSTNSWRKYDSRVPAYNYHIMHTSNICSMVHKNKTFCWRAKNEDAEIILSFDMEKEVFQETPLPSDIDDEFGGEKRTTRAIMPWKEKIGLVVYCMKEVEKFFDLWVLVNGDDVLGADWTKVSRIGGVVGVERPLGFWKNGHELVLESLSRELVLYDLNSKEISKLGIYGKRDRLELLVYIPTLASVNQ